MMTQVIRLEDVATLNGRLIPSKTAARMKAAVAIIHSNEAPAAGSRDQPPAPPLPLLSHSPLPQLGNLSSYSIISYCQGR